MEPFIRNDQYNFIKAQTRILINGHRTVNDPGVLNALQSITREKVLNLFTDAGDEQLQLISPIVTVKDSLDEERFLSTLKPYVIPFQVTEQMIKKLFRKVKKLTIPSLKNIDLAEISYLGWDDKGSGKKYIVAQYQNRLIGLEGTFNYLNKKGICAICNKYEEVGLLMCQTKGSHQSGYIARGNHICLDSRRCNQNLTTLEKLNKFIARLI
ncbi:FusB/FusC family EF-G-binding protein [Fictibacillus sp. Mic-4]|uniref:FusB/FusC family EF-G-binding protein n=1 Tax=Fictibacillus sp. Mic-4 TaxID=3132826 RepID=UPI003CF09386